MNPYDNHPERGTPGASHASGGGAGAAIAAIRRRYGAAERPATLSSRSAPLDLALGGGWPRGAISELSGDVGTGKSTLALCAAAGVLDHGGAVAWIDAEGAFPATLARSLGLGPGPGVNSHRARLVIVPPGSGEMLYEIACDLVGGGAVDLVVLDSVAAIDLADDGTPEGDRGRHRLHDDAARRLASLVARTGVSFLAIDQRRDRPGAEFGPRDQPAAGRSLGRVAAVRVALEPIEEITRGGERVGIRVGGRIVAHRYGAGAPVARLALRDGLGPWHAEDLVERARGMGIAWRELGVATGTVDVRAEAPGRDAVVDALDRDSARAVALAARLDRIR